MKALKYNKWNGIGTGILVALPFITSCSMEEPFKNDVDGQALVKMNLTFNSSTTRADEPIFYSDDCIVRIKNDNGVLFKWIGVNSIPPSIYLKYGNYTAEAFAGDSVPASFEYKYLKGSTSFNVNDNNITTQVNVNCKLANVVTSVDFSQVPEYLQDDLTVVISSSNAHLKYNKENLSDRGYFMMKTNPETGEREKQLYYTVDGKELNGFEFHHEGVIENVIPGHEYKLVAHKKESEDSKPGGTLVSISIEEYVLEVNESVDIYGEPDFAWSDPDMTLNSPLYAKDGDFKTSYTLIAAAFDGFQSLEISTENADAIEIMENQPGIDFIKATSKGIETFERIGITAIKEVRNDEICKYRITISKDFLNKLPTSETGYIFKVEACDNRGMRRAVYFTVSNNEKALPTPFEINTDIWASDPLSIKSRNAHVLVTLTNDEVENLILQYRKSGENLWQEIPMTITRATAEATAQLTGLSPKTLYQCRIVGGEKTGEIYQYATEISTFTTESEYDIPNGNMEDWFQNNGNCWEASTQANLHTFWDSGNDAMPAMTKLTAPSENYKTSGKYSAKLTTSETLGIIGAGNLFAGKFNERVGMSGAKVTFGQPYDGSHPKALRVYAKYEPGKNPTKKNGYNDSEFDSSANDFGQIFVAIASSACNLDTSAGNYFNPNASNILGYAEYTMKGAYDENGGMKEVILNIEYNERANTTEATHIIIVASSSKYGDYFAGAKNSTLYLDDFELIYE